MMARAKAEVEHSAMLSEHERYFRAAIASCSLPTTVS